MRIWKHSYVRFIIAAAVVFVVGLAIGGWQGSAKTVLNSVSAILLTVGALGVIALSGLEIVRRTRHA
ncbi:MAG: hypothetical protein JWO37_2901 [Acidimicrobiales bacterium]|jgi:hypothetical protein|nr:hypothetical protein [Acidimicrobiales bacterium]